MTMKGYPWSGGSDGGMSRGGATASPENLTFQNIIPDLSAYNFPVHNFMLLVSQGSLHLPGLPLALKNPKM